MRKTPIEPGCVVVSLAGRDQGRTFLVVSSIDDEYVYIVDGKTHKMDKPKKKKRRHLKTNGAFVTAVNERMTDRKPILDHEVRGWLSHEEG